MSSTLTWDPEEYARHSSAQLGWAQELTARLALQGSEALLDVGCGDGKMTAALSRALSGGFVLGVDSSPAFIAYARSHYPQAEYPNLRFEQMDARNLSYGRRFDVIFSNAVLHWVDDHPAFLAGCARLLRARGRLSLSCGGAGNAAEIIAVLEELIRQPPWAPCFTGFGFPYFFYSPEDYAGWLPAAGFEPLRLALVEKDMQHSGRAGLAGWIRTTWLPYTQRVPQAQRQAFIFSLVEAYLARQPLDAAGQCHVRMVRLEVEAQLKEHEITGTGG
jgi:trans-aconitate 2-methyltransferase